MTNSHQIDHEDLKQDKDLGVVHRQEQGPSPTLAVEDNLAGLMLVSATPNPALPQGFSVQWMLLVPWEPPFLETIDELLIKHSQRIRNYPVLRVGFAVYCRLSSWQQHGMSLLCIQTTQGIKQAETQTGQ